MSTLPPPMPDSQPVDAPDVPFAQPVSPLDEMQFLILRQAVIRRRPIRRAARVARGSAWTILVVAFAGWPVLLFMPNLSGLIVMAGLSAVGVLEYIGSVKMHRGEPSAPVFLARNQAMFILLIAAYCIYQMLTFSPEQMYSSPEMKAQMSQLTSLAGDLQRSVDTLVPLAYYAFYGFVMFLATICQGGLAVYYLTRRKHVDRFNRETPDWVKRIVTEVEL